VQVNDHDCSLQAQQLECLLPETRFESVRWWVATMISRSETYLLGGRRILVVGAGRKPVFNFHRCTFECVRIPHQKYFPVLILCLEQAALSRNL
jgi:hypothetical protein